ncbi:hypothetical protein [Lentzea sp. NPDC059081]|uniref:hypothetical protein n=1 Tax=Lentzea sp. NPDC059081 TaxID=3346719 RepID=UPI003674E7E0
MKISIILVAALFGLAFWTATPQPEPVRPTSTPPAPEPTTSVVTQVVTQTVTKPAQPGNRPGFGPLELGMTLAEVKATGLVAADFGTPPDTECWGDGSVVVSKKHGLVSIRLPAGTKTSTGVGVGSTAGEVRQAHPDAEVYRAGLKAKWTAESYVVFFATSGTIHQVADTDLVEGIAFRANTQDCPGAMIS